MRLLPNELSGDIDPNQITAQEFVYQNLHRAIMLGHLEPGKPVTIRGLAETLDTSPTPVREALRRLSSEHALCLLPNRRIVVPNMTADRFKALIEARIAIETHAADQALPYVNNVLIEKLTEIDQQIDKAVTDGNRDLHILTNQEFHSTLYKACPDPVCMPMIVSIWLQLGPFNRIAARKVKENYKVDRHKEALRALKARDASALRISLAKDINDGVGNLTNNALNDILETN